MNNLVLEVRRESDGRVLARRRDGKTLTQQDRIAAKSIAFAEPSLNATVQQEIRNTAGDLRAVAIYSALLEDRFWVILDNGFMPADDAACYYPDEVALLKGKSRGELRQIHIAKIVFPRSRIVQDG